MRNVCVVELLVCAAVLAPAPVAAQEGLFGFDVEFKLTGQLYNNFFQAPEEPKENIVGTELRLELSREASAPGRLRPYFRLRTTLLDKLDDWHAFQAGVASRGRPHSFDLSAAYQLGRPTLDVGDRFDTADTLILAGTYDYRLSQDFELSGVGLLQRQSFETQVTNDNTLLGIGGGVRYRGFGWNFSPELGVILGGRSADAPNEDHGQTDLYLKIRSAPSPKLYLSGRLRRRTRDYSVSDPAASNFEREDTRTQLALTGVYRVTERLAVDVYLTFEDADSTKESRVFTTQLLFVGLSMGF